MISTLEQVQDKDIKLSNLTPPFIYTISDNVGYIGSFYSISDIEDTAKAYPLVPLMVQCFKTSISSDIFNVWVILYKEIDAVAFVTNNRDDAIKMQATYKKIGLTYEDDVDYWQKPIGLSPYAKKRLDLLHADKKFTDILDSDYDRYLEKLDLSTEYIPGGPIEKLMQETKKITIFDCIVPCLYEEVGLSLEMNAGVEPSLLPLELPELNTPVDSPYVKIKIDKLKPSLRVHQELQNVLNSMS